MKVVYISISIILYYILYIYYIILVLVLYYYISISQLRRYPPPEGGVQIKLVHAGLQAGRARGGARAWSIHIGL